MLIKILKFLFILKEKINKLGYKRRKLNPFNPLSYLFLVLVVIFGLMAFGFIGISKEMDFKNPFKWQ